MKTNLKINIGHILIFLSVIFFYCKEDNFAKTLNQNDSLKIVSYPCAPESTFSIIDTNALLKGYIIVEFDSTKYFSTINNTKLISTYIYFVHKLSDSRKYFLNPYNLVFSGFLGYIESNDPDEIRNNHFKIDTSFFYSDEAKKMKNILYRYKKLIEEKNDGNSTVFQNFSYDFLLQYATPFTNINGPGKIYFIIKADFESAIFYMKCKLNYDASNAFYNDVNYFLLPFSKLQNVKRIKNSSLNKLGFRKLKN